MQLGLAPMDTSAKSAFLRPSTRERLRTNPARVRFAERDAPDAGDHQHHQHHHHHQQQQEHHLLFMPNVLKVYLENGQTKSFKFDSGTTVRDVVHWLQEKLRIEHSEHFALLLERVTATTTTTAITTTNATTNATTTNATTATTTTTTSAAVPALTLLPEGETLDKVVRRPDARSLRCRFRVAFYPRNAYEFLCRDPVAFEYFYLQCCNDVVRERWAGELSRETLLLLAALHMQQHATCSSSSSSSSSSSKYTVKHIVREWGMETFVPPSLLSSSKDRELRKTLNHHLKMHQQLTPLQLRVKLVQRLSDEAVTAGGKIFTANTQMVSGG
ncbi:FERM and PDZ domain-containing protein 4-like, partial [Lethenteron reissneri]|uniref:FERM and PDZ domain-containing protein 4-like n=1 Tax=Lethenteron reissneri TaxID=7753 RepID=UPI002AB6DD82